MNENTNGLLRQTFPKGTDLSRWSLEDLEAVTHRAQQSAPRDPRMEDPAEIFDSYARPVLHRSVELAQFRSRKFVCALGQHDLAGSRGGSARPGTTPPWKASRAAAKQRPRPAHLSSRDELRIATVTWIDRTHHRRTHQTALDQFTPIEYEAMMTTPASQAA